jgi:hypothetical protein
MQPFMLSVSSPLLLPPQAHAAARDYAVIRRAFAQMLWAARRSIVARLG